MSGPDAPDSPLFAFGEYLLDPANARLTRAGQPVTLTRKPLALLAALAGRSGDLVSKDHLLDTVWQRRFVSDSAVKSVLSELRQVLGDDARAPRWIETVAGRGYRFIPAVTRIARGTPGATTAGARGNLPAPVCPLVGREALWAELLPMLKDPQQRLLTLTGPAGVGKSLLAHHLADAVRAEARDGVWKIALATLPPQADAGLLRAMLAHTLRLSDAAARDDEALSRSMEGLQPLLLLDNAEHVIEIVAALAESLLTRQPGLRLLVTSREALHLPAERVLRVPPLDLPEPAAALDAVLATGAGRLFVQRARATMPEFKVEAAQAPLLAGLCRALDGLPLALELAAARVATLGVGGLHRELLSNASDAAGNAALRLLHGPRRGGEVRYHALRDALEWSFASLGEASQRVLRRLAVFNGPFELAAAQQVCADAQTDGWAVLDALDDLVARSLLMASGQEPRCFGLLNSIRAFAGLRLADSGEQRRVQRRHFDAQLRYWTEAEAQALSTPALAWAQLHDAALADLRAALAWGCDAVCRAPPELPTAALLQLAGAAGLVWHRAGHAAEGLRWCERVLALAGAEADPAARAAVELALAHLGGVAMVLPATQALAAVRRALPAYAHAGDRLHESYALYLEHTLMCRAEPEADRSATLARLQGLAEPGWSDLLRRFERSALAYEARLAGDHAVYRQFNTEELARCRALGAQWEAWSAGIGLMLAEHDGGRLDAAVEVGRSVLREIRATGRLRQNANRLAMWIMMLAESGDVAATRDALREALPILQGAGRLGMALLAGAWLALHEGRPGLAAQLLARFDAPGRTGSEFGPGTFIRRSVGMLWPRLRAALGDEGLAESCASAEATADAVLLERLLALPQ